MFNSAKSVQRLGRGPARWWWLEINDWFEYDSRDMSIKDPFWVYMCDMETTAQNLIEMLTPRCGCCGRER